MAVAVVASDPVFGGLGPIGGVRLAPQVELAGAGLFGRRGGATALRGELVLRAHAKPPRAGRQSWYLGGGLAVESGRAGSGYLVAAIGVEGGRQTQWFGEAGLGGGVRLLIGLRRRG